ALLPPPHELTLYPARHSSDLGDVLHTPRGDVGHDFRNRRRRQHNHSGTPLAIPFRQCPNRTKDFSLRGADRLGARSPWFGWRIISEEHTSEPQSLASFVCRLL